MTTPKSNELSYNIRKVEVRFPFPAYDCQIAFMEKVIEALQSKGNALLESPTGTGKTLCLLCGALAWRDVYMARNQLYQLLPKSVSGDTSDAESRLTLAQREIISKLDASISVHPENEDYTKDPPKIIYASRTHSQLSQAVKELKTIAYQPKVCVIGSREQMCINEDVLKKKSGAAKTSTCRSLVKKKKCKYHEGLSGRKTKGPPEIMDMEDLVKYGKKECVCPYYLSRESHAESEIIFVPYNYLVDSATRKSQKIDVSNSVLIFDEAHNLDSSCGEASSFDITSLDISACINLVQVCMDNAQATGEGNRGEFEILKALLIRFEEELYNIPLSSITNDLTKPGEFIFEVFEKINVNSENVELLREMLDAAVAVLSNTGDDKHNGSALSTFSEALKILFEHGLSTDGNVLSSSFKVHVKSVNSYKTSNSQNQWTVHKPRPIVRTLSFWCFCPGIAMKQLTTLNVRSVILASGTLAPLDSFATELQTDFQFRLENPHVIDADQAFVGIVPRGPSGHQLNSSFKTRNDTNYKADLGNSIVNFSRIVPDGLLVFFPSYGVMEDCVESWRRKSPEAQKSIWQRIQQYKEPFMEPKAKQDFTLAMEQFYSIVDKKKGAIFFAVCRGKVSEGLDFADSRGRAVIITGLPYPAARDPKILLKKQILDQAHAANRSGKPSLTGQEWYKQQAARAVNQAIGRVIRHKKDYGAILLCDDRFGYESSLSQLPVWVKPYVRVYNSFGEVQGQLTQFFKRMEGRQTVPLDLESTTSESSKTFTEMGHRALIESDKGFSTLFGAKKERGKFRKTIMPELDFGYSGLPTTAISMKHKAKKSSLLRTLSHYQVTNEMETSTESMLTAEERSSEKPSSLSRTNSVQSETVLDGADRPNLVSDSSNGKDSTRKGSTSAISGREDTRKKTGLRKDDELANSQTLDSRKNDAKAYIGQVKAALGPADHNRFQKLLKGYKSKLVSIEALIDGLVDLYTIHERFDLLRGFQQFVPPKHLELFNKVVEEQEKLGMEVGAVGFSNEKSDANVPKKRKKDDQVESIPIQNSIAKSNEERRTENDSNRGTTENHKDVKPNGCPICQQNLQNPFSSNCCGTRCCYGCWKRVTDCPRCGTRCKSKALNKVYFT